MHALLCLSGIPLMRNEANAYFEKRFYSDVNDKGMNKGSPNILVYVAFKTLLTQAK